MNQQPDKLFREKLENYHKPVAANAWNRIDTRLHKKNERGIWFRVAAALILLAVATFLLWPKKSTEGQPELLTKKSPLKTESPENKVAPAPEPEISNAIKKESTPLVNDRTPQKTRTPVQKPKARQEEVVPEVIITSLNEDKPTLPQPQTVIKNDDPRVTETMIAEISETKTGDEGVTIVYSAEEVDNKYLDKKSLAEATTGEKKSSTLRKLLDKARDLKNNQDAFGDLRQKKNEILALNFKSEKQRSQNK